VRLEEKIHRARKAIALAQARGQDTRAWEGRLEELEQECRARGLAREGLVLEKPVSLPVVGELREVSEYAASLLRSLEEARARGRKDLEQKCLSYLTELQEALEGRPGKEVQREEELRHP